MKVLYVNLEYQKVKYLTKDFRGRKRNKRDIYINVSLIKAGIFS